MKMLKLISFCFIFFSFLSTQAQVTDIKATLNELNNTIKKVDIDEQLIKQKVFSKESTIDLPFLELEKTFSINEFSMWGVNESPYKDIKSYKLKSIDNTVSGRVISTDNGVWITYMYNSTLIKYYPQIENNKRYYVREIGAGADRSGHTCATHGEPVVVGNMSPNDFLDQNRDKLILKTNGSIRRQYRVAVVLTGEYIQANGGLGVARDLSVVNVSDISAIFENEIASELVMAPRSPIIRYSDPATDIFDPNGGGRTDQAAEAVNLNFARDSYDIGHVFHNHQTGDGWDTGGVARLNSVCRDQGDPSEPPSKAFGWSGSFNNQGNGFVNLAAHEFGHQYGATHTFNGIGNSCTGAISGSSAYEIGSGTTIMSYQSLCNEDNNISSSGIADNYFHNHSLVQMIDHIETSVCNEDNWIIDINTPPVSNPNPFNIDIYEIPRSTPFYLNGAGTDEDGDPLTFCWEQYDEDGAGMPTQGEIGNTVASNFTGPSFRSYPPTGSTERYFPRLSAVMNGNQSSDFEVLARSARMLNFRLTVRDNNPAGGGVDWGQIRVNVRASGPLRISFPNGLNTFSAGETIDVEWGINGSEELCEMASICASTDGGLSFPYVLAENVDYDSESVSVTIPAGFPKSENVRFMIKCSDEEGYFFFDISDRDLEIDSNCEAPNVLLCDTEREEFPIGDPGLNFGFETISGSPAGAISDEMSGNTRMIPGLNNVNGACIRPSFPENPYTPIPFQVDNSGSYTISIDNDQDDVVLYSIYRSSTFQPQSPCNSFIESNAFFDGGLSFQLSFTADLESCEEYILVAHQTRNDATDINIASISGPGNFIINSENADFSKTFIAVNESTKIIEEVNDNADFRSLDAGTFSLQSINYKASGAGPPDIVDPQQWKGLTVAAVRGRGECYNGGFNEKIVDIISTCTVQNIVLGQQSACDPNTNTYSQSLSFNVNMGPTSGELVVNGQNFTVNSQDLNITLTGLPADGMPVNLSFEFSADGACNRVLEEVFTAPESCCPITIDLPDMVMGCDNTPEELDAGPDGVSYIWTKDGVDFSDQRTISVTEAGTYTVIVDNGNCTVQDVSEVTFNDSPSLAIGPDITGCDGNPELFEVSTSADSIVWLRDGIEVAVNTASFDITSSGNYEVIATNEFGCSTSGTFSSMFSESPIIEIGEDETLCEGTPKQLTTGEDASTYIWSRDGTPLAETSNTLDVTMSGEYTVVATNIGGCPSRDTVNITFSDLPDLDLGMDIERCEGDIYNIVANANGFNIEWYLGNTLIDDENEVELTADVSGEYIALVSAGVGCEIADTINVDYIVAPTTELGDDLSACPGEVIPLNAGDDADTYFWSAESLGIILDMDNEIDVTTTDTYYVTATNAAGCPKTDTITVTFTELPMLDLGANIERCEGEEQLLMAQSNGFEVQWLLDANVIDDETEEALIVTTSGTYTAIVSANPTCSIEDEVTVTFNENPELTPINDLSPCEGDEVLLESGADGEFVYVWTLSGTTVQEGPEGSYNVTSDGEYIVVATNDAMCTSSDTAQIQFIETPLITLDETFDFCEGATATIVADANALIEWYLDDNIIPNQSGEELEITEPGEYIGIVGAGGTCATSDTIQVSAIAAPEFIIDGITQGCEGDDVVLMIDGATNEDIVWEDGNTVIPNETDVDYTATDSGIYTATLTNSTACATSQSIEVNFFAVAENEIIMIPDNLCEGTAFMMNAETSGSRFAWFSDGVLLDDETDLTFEITESGSYSFIGYNEIDCETITEFEVNFNPSPMVDLGDDIRTECLGIPVELSVPDENGNEYIWTMDGTPISDLPMITVMDNPGEYSVNVTNSFGCSDTDITTISFNEPPTLMAETEASYCEGLEVELEVETNAAEINWTLGSTDIANNVNTISANTAGTYTVEVISDDGCAITEDIVVTENPNPVLSIEDVELCPDEMMDINIDTGFASYEWTGVTATGASATVAYEEVNEITTETASLMVTDIFGCVTTADFAISYFPVINAAVVDQSIEICIGQSAELNASGGLNYTWTDSGGSLSATDISNPVATPDQTTTYFVEVSDNCPGNVEELSVVVVVNNLPVANAGLDTCALLGIPFQLNATGGSSYSWDNTDVIDGSASVSDPIIDIDMETTFTVTVTDDFGCQATDDIVVCVKDPIDELDPVTIITPNGDGSNDELLFRGLEAFPENEITIFNRWGTVIFQKNGYQNDAVRWNGTRDGQELPADTYYYILKFADSTIKKSITVLRN